jgi:HAD superfamily hydrolase (TIGR01450 family)
MRFHTLDELFARHRLFLIDAYGVLVTSSGALPGARDFMERLNRDSEREYFIITNDASRLPEECAIYYASHGVPVASDRILTAGLAIQTGLSELKAPRCFVLGTQATKTYVERAGGTVAPHDDKGEFDAVVVGDDSGFDVLPTLNALLTALHRKHVEGAPRPRLLLANSDFLYPRGSGGFGFTSGAIAKLLLLGLEHLHPEAGWAFETLGKPEAALFNLALKRARFGAEEAVMIGDQLPTDIRGANRAGLASALMASGLTKLPLDPNLAAELRPTYILRSL